MDEQTLKKYKDHIVDAKTQKDLNKPLNDKTGFNEGHETFLNMLIGKIESGEINPHKIETLHNKEVFETLSEEDQEATDLTGHNIMSIIRQIERMWKLEQKPSFQIQNLVETVYQMKSKFEEKHGDVYII